MKILLSMLLGMMLIGNVYAGTETKTKEVCKQTKDKSGKIVKDKDGNPVKTCKTIKVHKKLEGNKVPDQKK